MGGVLEGGRGSWVVAYSPSADWREENKGRCQRGDQVIPLSLSVKVLYFLGSLT